MTIFKNCFGKTGLSSSCQERKTASSITPLWHSWVSYNIHAHDLGSTQHKINTDAHMGSWVSDWENKASRSWPFAPWAGKGSREAGGKPSSPGEKQTWSLFSPLQKGPFPYPRWAWPLDYLVIYSIELACIYLVHSTLPWLTWLFSPKFIRRP